jgi:hypothetical protein
MKNSVQRSSKMSTDACQRTYIFASLKHSAF